MQNSQIITLQAEKKELLELVAKINEQLPKKEQNEQTKIRASNNKDSKNRLLNFVAVYSDVKKNYFCLSNRASQSSIHENKNNIFKALKNNCTEKQMEKIEKIEKLPLHRLEKVMTNIRLLQFFLSEAQRAKAQNNERAFSVSNITDLILKVLLFSDSNYERTLQLYKAAK